MAGMSGKFGIQYSSFSYPEGNESIYSHISEVALECERLGFDSFTLADHFFSALGPPQEPFMEAWTTLSALSVTTQRIRLGSLVSSNLFRNPALLAKMAATVDVISNGRLILGVGSGNLPKEYQMYGLSFGTPRERIGRLEEALQVITMLWSGDQVDFEGRYYSLEGAICSPGPLQKPRPPIMVGGDGQKATLRLVARYGDMCNIHGSPEAIREKLDSLDRHCGSIGRDPAEVLKTRHSFAIIGETDAEVKAKAQGFLDGTGLAPSVLDSFDIGTPGQLTELYRRHFDAGLDYLIVNFRRDAGVEPVQLFAQQVMPNFS
ncbi:MAG: LLM class F420-dependent oxidoreductase [Dehalococcoidia bacterium]|nr:LLM class F420-dependent oxidoreductase [Dehalococcoidia bacterium]